MASLMPMPRQAFFFVDPSGRLQPLVGGKLYTYEAGTSTPKATYTTQAGDVPNANPVILDARGEAGVWLGTGAYKIVLTDENDVTIYTEDAVSTGVTEADLADTTDTTKGAALVGFKRHDIATAVERSVYDRLLDINSLHDVGTTSAAIQAVLNDTGVGKAYVFGKGAFTANSAITLAGSNTVLDLSAATVASSLANGTLLTISGSDNTVLIDLDMQNNPCTPIQITGSRNKVKAVIRNLCATPGMTNTYLGGIDNRGADNVIDVIGLTFTNTGYADNGSFPHLVTCQGGAARTHIVRAVGRDVVSGVICGLSTDTHVGYLDVDGATDNGLYGLENATNITAEFVRYRGDEEPVVSKSIGMHINTLELIDPQAAIGIDNCAGFIVDHLIVNTQDDTLQKAARTPLIQTRTGNVTASGIKIHRITGNTYGNNIFQFNTGAVSDVLIHNVELTHHYHDAAQLKSLYSHASGDRVDLRGWRLRVVDDTAALIATDTFTITLPAELTTDSFYDNNRLSADGTHRIRVVNIGQDWLFIGGNPPAEVSAGPYLRESEYLSAQRKQVVSSAAPTTGTWGKGDIVWASNVSAGGTVGWVCVTAGSPGTWKTFGSVAA